MESEKTTEVAEPLDDYEEITDEDDEVEPAEDDDLNFQTDEQNSAFAQYRRENEQLKAQIEEIDQSFAQQFKDYGVSDAKSYLEKLQEQQETVNRQELEAQASEGDVNALQELAKQSVLKDPAIQEVLNQNQMAMQVLEQQQTEQARAELNRQIEELNQSYGLNIDGIEGLLTLPNADNVLDYMEKGLNATDAYLLVNKDDVMKGEHKKAKQSYVNKVGGRSHMKTSSGQTEKIENVEIPEDVYKSYKAFFPEMTSKQIREAYTKELKKEGVI